MKKFTFHELVEVCETIRVDSKHSPNTRTIDLVIDTLINKGVLFRVYININNDNWLKPTLRETLEFWSEKEALNYTKGFNDKHGWKHENVDYLTANYFPSKNIVL